MPMGFSGIRSFLWSSDHLDLDCSLRWLVCAKISLHQAFPHFQIHGLRFHLKVRNSWREHEHWINQGRWR